MADASKAATTGPTKTEILLHLIIEELGGGSISYAAWGKIAEALSKTEEKPVTFNAARFRYSTFKKKMKAAGYDGKAGEDDNEDEEPPKKKVKAAAPASNPKATRKGKAAGKEKPPAKRKSKAIVKKVSEDEGGEGDDAAHDDDEEVKGEVEEVLYQVESDEA
jgi:hypothetical protein